MAGRCCIKRGSIAFAKSQLTMIGLLFASGASSSSSSPSSSHGNHATKWHLVTRLLGLPLNARQRREIDQIGQKFQFNLAPPPSSLDEITTGPKFVSLTDFIEQFDWEYSDLDIIDRLEIADLDLENFWRYIAKSEVPIEESGHLSPVTVAKGIEYGVSLLGCFIEACAGSKQGLGKEGDFGTIDPRGLGVRPGHFRNLFG